VAVALHDRLHALDWLAADAGDGYALTDKGAAALANLGIDVQATQAQRRRFAFACLDWSERRPHLGGALGAAVLTLALRKRWVARDLDSRVLTVTAAGRRELLTRFRIKDSG